MPAVFVSGILAVVSCGGIFGFFYAWVCSTMWGLDALPPQTAIAAMQAMNASVRNGVFAICFFGTPGFLALAAFSALRVRKGPSAMLFTLAALVYAAGGIALTASINVPMNEALAGFGALADPQEAARIWAEYSPRWQFWNQIRTGFSGVALVLSVIAFGSLGFGAAPERNAFSRV
ncbi:DUF1772 domain-containing protein [Roseibium sediminis]|uniref:anthrone oxygenase family protein n=1 Tax=Roseibium sediminis TaxID=1775174 RepID=UPI00123D49D5|nr:anthrone oxygenase family protein [Roseibium sediminis]